MRVGSSRGRRIDVLAAAVAAAVTAGCAPGGGAGTAPGTPASVGVARDVAPPRRPGPAPTGRGATPVADVPLPDENGRSGQAEATDWTTNEDPAQAWRLDPCRPTAYPTDARRSSFRTVSRTGPELADARQLAVYPSAAEAAEARGTVVVVRAGRSTTRTAAASALVAKQVRPSGPSARSCGTSGRAGRPRRPGRGHAGRARRGRP